MSRAEAAIPVKVRREGRRTTTIQTNVRDEGTGPLTITTKDETGWWRPLVVDPTSRDIDQPLTLVELSIDLPG